MLKFEERLEMLQTDLMAPSLSRTHFVRCAFFFVCRRILLLRLASLPRSDTREKYGQTIDLHLIH